MKIFAIRYVERSRQKSWHKSGMGDWGRRFLPSFFSKHSAGFHNGAT